MQGRAVQFGGLVQTPANISDTKNYNLGKHIFAYNSQTVCRTFKNLVSPDSLNGAESLCEARPTSGSKVFSQNRKNWKTYFFELLLGI